MKNDIHYGNYIHSYKFFNMLRPSGFSMDKESLSLLIYEALVECVKEWSDKKYSDNLDINTIKRILKKNIEEEMNVAWEKFNKEYK